MNIRSIVLFIFLLPNIINVCTCPPKGNWKDATLREYNYSKYVFLGDVKSISKNQLEYELEVCDVFKGDLKAGQIIKGENFGTCGPYVDKKGEWVLFGKYSTKFQVNDCGISSNIAEPIGLVPPPPPPQDRNIEYDKKKVRKEWKTKLKKSIEEQINILRNISESK